jgi:hypothetical protein
VYDADATGGLQYHWKQRTHSESQHHVLTCACALSLQELRCSTLVPDTDCPSPDLVLTSVSGGAYWSSNGLQDPARTWKCRIMQIWA